MIKQLFWRTFYKVTLGSNYSTVIKSTKNTYKTINEASQGNLSSFYNINGEQIRGWHRPSVASRKKKASNDPMDRYINEYR
jgi:hypothetical protein